MSDPQKLRGQSGNARDHAAPSDSLNMSAISDDEAVQLLNHPIVAKLIKDMAATATKKLLEASERRISELEVHVKGLEADVEGF
jgi:hypothetical protein